MLVVHLLKKNVLSFTQFVKVLYSPIHFTDAGIVMEVKLLQYAKHKEPIDVTDAGMVIEVKLLHP